MPAVGMGTPRSAATLGKRPITTNSVVPTPSRPLPSNRGRRAAGFAVHSLLRDAVQQVVEAFEKLVRREEALDELARVLVGEAEEEDRAGMCRIRLDRALEHRTRQLGLAGGAVRRAQPHHGRGVATGAPQLGLQARNLTRIGRRDRGESRGARGGDEQGEQRQGADL